MSRIASIDATRGTVMIIMALDHVRDFMHVTALTQNPTDLTTTTPLLFFTRLITHLCAPTFVFLAGMSAFLYVSAAGKEQGRSFLIKRGAWLLLLEFTVVNLALFFDLKFRAMMFEVIAATGVGFLVLGLTLNVAPKILGLVGLLIIFGQGLLPLIPFQDGSVIRSILSPLFNPGGFPFSADRVFVTGYPPIPWIGIMLIGFSVGSLMKSDIELRSKQFLKFGLLALGTFVVIRSLNFYGDAPWSTQVNELFTFLSFINVTKYPPTLLFVLLTLGIMFLILFMSEKAGGQISRILCVYGRAPLFYFVIHLYIAHFLMLVIMMSQGFGWADLNFGAFGFGRPKGESGVGLSAVYMIWIGVVVVMYPLCRWFGDYKANHREKTWLRYL